MRKDAGQTVGLPAVLSIVVGSIIGAGIFMLPVSQPSGQRSRETLSVDRLPLFKHRRFIVTVARRRDL